jgi:hypothetical protein
LQLFRSSTAVPREAKDRKGLTFEDLGTTVYELAGRQIAHSDTMTIKNAAQRWAAHGKIALRLARVLGKSHCSAGRADAKFSANAYRSVIAQVFCTRQLST